MHGLNDMVCPFEREDKLYYLLVYLYRFALFPLIRCIHLLDSLLYACYIQFSLST